VHGVDDDGDVKLSFPDLTKEEVDLMMRARMESFSFKAPLRAFIIMVVG